MYEDASTDPVINRSPFPEISPDTDRSPVIELLLLLPLPDTNSWPFLYMSPEKFIEPKTSNA